MKKKLSYFMILAAFISFGVLTSCGDEETTDDTENDTIMETGEITTDETDEVATADFSAGKEVYEGKGTCSTCHQADGSGVAGTFPPLAETDYLADLDKETLIKQIIFGSEEAITINDVEYPGNVMGGTMSGLEISDQEFADAINYVSNTWGNKIIVTADDVNAAR